MTALVVLGVFLIIAMVVLGVWIGYIKALQAGAFRKMITVQRNLILEIEDKAMSYGYPTDPLSYDIVHTIRDSRKKENK